MNKKIYNSAVLALFFEDPEGVYYIREISRLIKKHPNTVLKEVALLIKEKLVCKRETKAIVEIRANRENELFTQLKRIHNLREVVLSGLIGAVHREYNAPEAIVLFGSFSRGEDIKKSDIDIAVISKRTVKKDWSQFAQVLKHSVQMHEIDKSKTNKNFTSTLINGIVLKGYLDI